MPSRNKARLGLLALICLLAAPTTWLRSEPSLALGDASYREVEFTAERTWPDGLETEGIWQIESGHALFGGFSAMLPPEDGRLRLFSDRGWRLDIDLPGAGETDAKFEPVEPPEGFENRFQDIESVTSDPETGTYWLGYEMFHAIRRMDADGQPHAMVRPAQMRHWPNNSGAEAMLRLPGGQFIVLPEYGGPALLFDRDPVQGGRAETFAFTLPEDFVATALANLPDGRVLILVRGLDWAVPPFTARLLVADPASIEASGTLEWEELLSLDGRLPRENYEGLAVEMLGDESLRIWLVADDNLWSVQRSLLVALRWDMEAPISGFGQ